MFCMFAATASTNRKKEVCHQLHRGTGGTPQTQAKEARAERAPCFLILTFYYFLHPDSRHNPPKSTGKASSPRPGACMEFHVFPPPLGVPLGFPPLA